MVVWFLAWCLWFCLWSGGVVIGLVSVVPLVFGVGGFVWVLLSVRSAVSLYRVAYGFLAVAKKCRGRKK